MDLPVGKLDAGLLAELLGRIERRDPRVIVGPRVGEDAAAIDFGDRCLVVAGDPITFATERLGWYAVQVNANDIAVMGARPRWLTATLLLPEKGADRALVEGIFNDLLAACDALGVALCGGHTEITHGLPRPILIGQMMGEVARERLLSPANARPGDRVLLCKGVAIEATSLIARERADEVRGAFGEAFRERAAAFLDEPGISVVDPALRAAAVGGVRVMHDPTEGGIATALREVALAAGTGIRVRRDAISIYPETERLCAHYSLDPLGIIASGALLIVCAPSAVAAVIAALDAGGFPCADLGELTPTPGEYLFETPTGNEPLPTFAVDEIARLFA